MSVFRTVVRVFGARSLGSVIAFVSFVVFARELGAAAFGAFVLFQAIVNFVGSFVDLGIDEAVEKRISEAGGREEAGDLLVTAVAIETVAIVGIGVLILGLRPLVNEYVGAEVAVLLVPVLLVHRMGWLLLHTLRGELSVDRSAYFEVVHQATFLVVGFALVRSGFGVRGAIYGYGLGWFLLCVASYSAASTRPGDVTGGAARSLFDFSKYNFVASVLRTSAYSWIDVLIVGVFLTQSHVAAYEAAWRLTLVVMLFSQAIAHTLFPQVSDWFSRQKLTQIEQVIPDAVTGSLLLVFPSAAGAWVLGGDLLEQIFGPEYAVASAALVVLLFGKVAEALNNVYRPVLLGIDRPDLAATSAVVFLLLNTGLNLLLVWQYGLVGAAVATSVAFGVYTALNRQYLERYLALPVDRREVAACVLASAGMGLVLWLLRRRVSVDSFSQLLGLVVTGAAVYSLLLLADAPFRERAFELVTDGTDSPSES